MYKIRGIVKICNVMQNNNISQSHTIKRSNNLLQLRNARHTLQSYFYLTSMAEKESELSTRFKHVLPGEHVYEGILFFGYTPPDILDAVKEFEVRDDDVFLATYPKAGNKV